MPFQRLYRTNQDIYKKHEGRSSTVGRRDVEVNQSPAEATEVENTDYYSRASQPRPAQDIIFIKVFINI